MTKNSSVFPKCVNFISFFVYQINHLDPKTIGKSLTCLVKDLGLKLPRNHLNETLHVDVRLFGILEQNDMTCL